MKKLISLILCALTIMTLSLTAFATPAPVDKSGETMSPAGSNKPSAEVQSTCAHSWGYVRTVYNGYVWRSNSTCALEVCHKLRCNICNIATKDEFEYMDPASHSGSVYAASCSGTVQTWHCTCSRCGGHFTKTITCPGGPHTPGYCKVLPV